MSADLVKEFRVSEDTIRRDLKDLADVGLLKKVHGGALTNTTVPYNYKAREHLNLDAKSAMAEKAVRLVRKNMLIFIDGGTTSAQLPHHLPKDLQATFVTHSIATAAALADLPQSEIIFLGGRVISELLITSGAHLLEECRQFRPDLCLISVHGLSPSAGATVESYDDAVVKREFIRNSAETAILAGREKLGFSASYCIADVKDISYLISDAPAADMQAYADVGITVWTV